MGTLKRNPITFGSLHTSTPQLPFKTPQIPSNRDHKALNRGTLVGLGSYDIPTILLGFPVWVPTEVPLLSRTPSEPMGALFEVEIDSPLMLGAPNNTDIHGFPHVYRGRIETDR